MTVNSTVSTDRRLQLPLIAWVLVYVVTAVGLYAWGNSIDWQFSNLSAYSLFPVLGVIAFSIMWTHYIIGALRTYLDPDVELKRFFNWTGYIVLILILLHPGLLIYQRFQDGFGLPPGSYKTYVAPSMAWLTLLGSVSLLAFLAYELKRWFDSRSWWKYVLYANEAAMIAIFYHGLQLGTQTITAWYTYVWWFYGLTLLAALVYDHSVNIKKASSVN